MLQEKIMLTDLMMQGNLLPDAIKRVFSFMKIAEGIIDEQKDEHPDQKDLINEAFQYLLPSEILLNNGTDKLFGLHCREIIQRLRENTDLSLGTDAEILTVLKASSLKAMLSNGHQHVYESLIVKHFGTKIVQESVREDWPGQGEEIIGTYRKKLRATERKLRKEA